MVDFNEMLRFIQWDEQRIAQAKSQQRTIMVQDRQFALQQKKFALSYGKEIQRIQEKEIETDKATALSLTSSYKDAKSLAFKNTIRETMKSFYATASPSSKTQLTPYIKHSPISPKEEKRNEFFRTNPEIPKPTPEEMTANPYIAADYKFAVADRRAKYDNFMFGTPFKRSSFVGMENEGVAYRDDKGLTHLLSKEDWRIKEISDKLGVPVAELYATDGWYENPKSVGEVVRNGEVFAVYGRQNVLRKPITKEVDGKITPVRGEESYSYRYSRKAPDPSQIEIPAAKNKLVEGIIGNDVDNSTAQYLRKLILSGPEGIQKAIEALQFGTSDLTFTIDTYAGEKGFATNIPFIGRFFDGKQEAQIAVTKGQETWLPIAKNKFIQVWIDNRTGTTRNKYGSILGNSPEEAVQNSIKAKLETSTDAVGTKKLEPAFLDFFKKAMIGNLPLPELMR